MTKLICVVPEDINIYNKHPLVVGNIYYIKDESDIGLTLYYVVYDQNDNQYIWCGKYQFITLEEHRNNQLNCIL